MSMQIVEAYSMSKPNFIRNPKVTVSNIAYQYGS